MDDYERPQTRLPTHIEKEDPFLKIAEIDLSLRQMMTIIGAGMVWWLACWITGMVVGFVVVIPEALLWLMYSWIIVGGFYLALKKVDLNGNGIKMTYEEYLTKKILFQTSPTQYVVKEKREGSIEDADWTDVDDGFAGWSTRK